MFGKNVGPSHKFSNNNVQNVPRVQRIIIYVSAKATYIRLLHGKIGILGGFFGPSSVHRGRTHIVFG